MSLGRKTEFIVYTLGKFYSLYDKKLHGNFLEVAVSKKVFIYVIKNASITSLSERMIYRHLEYMEKKKLIKYTNKKIIFTKRGINMFNRIKKRFEDYFKLGQILTKKNILKLSSKSQTFFSKK